MPYETQPSVTAPLAEASDLLAKLLREKRSARELQERKHQDWNDNYELARGKVRTNRLTQRQTVNIPLMKETLKTLLSKIDDPPAVDWRELSGDQQKELYFREIWGDQFKRRKLELVDVLDKKSVLLYGLSTKKLNVSENGVDIHVMDPYDVLIDPLTDPLDIETARFIVNQNIFRSLRDVLADERYAEEGKAKLKDYLSQKEGIVQSSKNAEDWKNKMERMRAMGIQDDKFPLFAGGDVVLNLSEHFTEVWDTKAGEYERRVVVYANDTVELMNRPLEELIGVSFWPFVSWSEDPETNDIYPDSVADLVRTPNKVLNVWFSQLVENRTLRNFQMHWYDATASNYTPQTYEPGPGRMLPAPGDPGKTIMPVNIQGLDETLTAIDFLIRMVERGTGATAIEKGVSERKQITLGEVQVLVGKAMERVVGMAKFYRAGWQELASKWAQMMHANPPARISLYKAGRSGKTYGKVLYPSDWRSEKGYEAAVSSSSEQEEEKAAGLQKFAAVKAQFPNNKALARISQRRMLQILDLTPEEMREVEEEEKKAAETPMQPALPAGIPVAPAAQPNAQPNAQPQAPEQSPETDQLLGEIASKLQSSGVL